MPDGTSNLDRKKILSLLALSAAVEDMGVYPQAVSGGPKPYEKRTDYMEGWNAHGTELIEKWVNISTWLNALPPEHKHDIEEFLLNEKLSISVEDAGKIRLLVNCSDLFFWASCDAEEFVFEDLADFKRAFEESPEHGDILWCCRKRGMRPQRPYYKHFGKEEALLFDAAGPERKDA
jgi:hypothetical protein